MSAAPAPDFPIPYIHQGPSDDLRDALSLLRVVDMVMEDAQEHGLSRDAAQELVVPFSIAVERIKLVIEFLVTDDRPSNLEHYHLVRRQEIAKSYGRGMA